MKKFINILFCTIVAMMAMSTFTNAQTVPQVNTWLSLDIQGDELTGSSDDVAFAFITEKGNGITRYASHPATFVLSANKDIFDFQTSRYSSLVSENVIVGYYNENDELIDKEETYLFKLGKYSTGVLESEKLLNYMTNKPGFVRFRAKLYRGTYFDEKVSTWKSTPPVKVKIN